MQMACEHRLPLLPRRFFIITIKAVILSAAKDLPAIRFSTCPRQCSEGPGAVKSPDSVT